MEENDYIKKQYGDNVILTGIVETEDRRTVRLKSTSTKAVCPCCLAESNKHHSTKVRYIQDVPVGKGTMLELTAYQYDCQNKSCDCKVFNEKFDFVDTSSRMTFALVQLIIVMATKCSNKGTAEALNQLGVKITGMAIGNLLSRITIMDDPDIERIGVDDASIRKGQEYVTTIYDYDTHRAIAVLKGRDGNALKEWLSGHTKVNIVARDRASAYASAISEVLPGCVQVADRFHIMSNLLEAIKDIVKDELPYYFYIKDGKVLAEGFKGIIDDKYNNSPVFDKETGIHIEVVGRHKDSKKYELVKKNSSRFKKSINW
jgi:transposase